MCREGEGPEGSLKEILRNEDVHLHLLTSCSNVGAENPIARSCSYLAWPLSDASCPAITSTTSGERALSMASAAQAQSSNRFWTRAVSGEAGASSSWSVEDMRRTRSNIWPWGEVEKEEKALELLATSWLRKTGRNRRQTLTCSSPFTAW